MPLNEMSAPWQREAARGGGGGGGMEPHHEPHIVFVGLGVWEAQGSTLRPAPISVYESRLRRSLQVVERLRATLGPHVAFVLVGNGRCRQDVWSRSPAFAYMREHGKAWMCAPRLCASLAGAQSRTNHV